MAKYIATVVDTAIKYFPRVMKILPIPAAIANKKPFLRIRKNASLQQVQKPFPVIAH